MIKHDKTTYNEFFKYLEDLLYDISTFYSEQWTYIYIIWDQCEDLR